MRQKGLTVEDCLAFMVSPLCDPPTFILPIPPSDNTRLKFGAVKKKDGSRIFRQFLSPQASSYLKMWRPVVGHNTVEPGAVCILLAQFQFENRRRDGSNCFKVLKDTLFDEDRDVLAWELPQQLNRLNPHVRVWLFDVKLSTTGAVVEVGARRPKVSIL